MELTKDLSRWLPNIKKMVLVKMGNGVASIMYDTLDGKCGSVEIPSYFAEKTPHNSRLFFELIECNTFLKKIKLAYKVLFKLNNKSAWDRLLGRELNL